MGLGFRVYSIFQRVQVPNNLVIGFWVTVIIVQVLGKVYDFKVLGPLGFIQSTTKTELVSFTKPFVGNHKP